MFGSCPVASSPVSTFCTDLVDEVVTPDLERICFVPRETRISSICADLRVFAVGRARRDDTI